MGYCFSPISWWCSFPNVFFILIDCICILQISSQRSFDFRSGRISTFIYRFCDSHRNWFLGSYFTKAPLPQIQLRFSVGLKTAERQFMTFASPPFNRWDIWYSSFWRDPEEIKKAKVNLDLNWIGAPIKGPFICQPWSGWVRLEMEKIGSDSWEVDREGEIWKDFSFSLWKLDFSLSAPKGNSFFKG